MKNAIWLVSIILLSCSIEEEVNLDNNAQADLSNCRAPAVTLDLYYEKGEKTFLWADEDSSKHFNVTGWTLNACNLRNGVDVGRETFQALVQPEFDWATNVEGTYDDSAPAVLVKGPFDKVYPLETLVVHEAINDFTGGSPILVVYCFLADLVTVYDRRYCGSTLTFGVSGWTYSDEEIEEGLESFLLWDRNSESLWWPIIDRGVSGAFEGYNMTKLNSQQWQITTMKNIFDNYPTAKVLKKNQTVDNPPVVPKLDGC